MALHSDSTVLEGLAGDLDAGYEAFVAAHSGAVYSTALRLSGSRAEADDLAQETFVRAYRALRRFDAQRVLSLESRPWLLTITVNLWRNRLRRAARRPREAGSRHGEVEDGRRGPEAVAETAEESRFLVALLLELPDHHRVPVVLRHVVGLSYVEISATLDCPVGTAKANVARGLDRLRALACATPTPASPLGVAPRAHPRSRSRRSAHSQEAP